MGLQGKLVSKMPKAAAGVSQEAADKAAIFKQASKLQLPAKISMVNFTIQTNHRSLECHTEKHGEAEQRWGKDEKNGKFHFMLYPSTLT